MYQPNNYREKYKKYFQKIGYKEIVEKKLISENESSFFTISSIENAVDKIKCITQQEEKYYTIQRTFRCKKSHFNLWGYDAFLTPFNIMMSTFAFNVNILEAINDVLNFAIKTTQISKENLFCVYSKDNQIIIDNLIDKYLISSNLIEVPESCLQWQMPLNNEHLNGRYIKFYVRHYTGFILLCEANITSYKGHTIVDTAISYGVLEALAIKQNTIYDTSGYRPLVTQLTNYKSPLQNNDYKFVAIFFAANFLLLDGGRPGGKSSNSIIKMIMRLALDYDYCHSHLKELLSAVQEGFIQWTYPVTSLELEEIYAVWESENQKYLQTKRNYGKVFNKALKKGLYNNDPVLFSNTLKDTYGVPLNYTLQNLLDMGLINSKSYNDCLEKTKYYTPTCAITRNETDMHYSTDKIFLKSLFLEKL